MTRIQTECCKLYYLSGQLNAYSRVAEGAPQDVLTLSADALKALSDTITECTFALLTEMLKDGKPNERGER